MVRPRLSSLFQNGDPVACARGLLGLELRVGECAGRIVETEAYCRAGDDACHTAMYRRSREFAETAAAGTLYVFHHLGVHWLLNFAVAGAPGGLVLIRALEPTAGLHIMERRARAKGRRGCCSGPALLTRALGIDGRFHGSVLGDGCPVELCEGIAPSSIRTGTRIGIRRSADLPWRFEALSV